MDLYFRRRGGICNVDMTQVRRTASNRNEKHKQMRKANSLPPSLSAQVGWRLGSGVKNSGTERPFPRRRVDRLGRLLYVPDDDETLSECSI